MRQETYDQLDTDETVEEVAARAVARLEAFLNRKPPRPK